MINLKLGGWKEKEKETPKWGQCLSSRRKNKNKNKPPNGGSVHWAKEKEKEKTDNQPPFWGPVLVEEMKNELALKNRASTHWVKEKRKRNPQMGAVLIEQRKKRKKKEWLAPWNRGCQRCCLLSLSLCVVCCCHCHCLLFVIIIVVVVCHCHYRSCVMSGSCHITGHHVLLASSVGVSTTFK